MEQHDDKPRVRKPGVSPVGLLTAACVFVIAAFCAVNAGFGESSYQDLENATRNMTRPKEKQPSVTIHAHENQAEKAIAILEKNMSGRKDETPAADTAPAKKRNTATARKAKRTAAPPVKKSAAQSRASGLPEVEKRSDTKQRAAAPGQKVPSAVKLPITGQKIPDKVIKVEVPPPPTDKNDAPEWYTVKLKPVANKTLAEATASGLRARGFVESSAVTGPNGTYYVKIGGYGFRNAAEDAKKQLSSLGFTDAHIEEKTVAK